MTRAAYEYKQIAPSVVVAILAGALGLACASAVVAGLPVDGWSIASDQPIRLPGYLLLRVAWQESFSDLLVLVLNNGLGPAAIWRLMGVGVAVMLGLVMGFSITYVATPLTDRRLHLDGTQLMSGKPATSAARIAMLSRRQPRERPIQLAETVPYTRLWRVLNLLIVGAIGSGKTRIILFLLEQFLARSGPAAATTAY